MTIDSGSDPFRSVIFQQSATNRLFYDQAGTELELGFALRSARIDCAPVIQVAATP
jgi:hypothetical protein